ncbi:MAG: hypothetical protein HY865_09630 [Chloroflexi bacterium]|jgi:hypothetical protein|nr:hypothetical protein [Chloroflexota bacterium]
MVDLFHWSLTQIDETDIESLIPFVFRYPKWKSERGAANKRKELFADQVDWLN